MESNKAHDENRRIEAAKALVRKILVEDAGQKLDDDTLKTVADKIVRTLPDAA
jgi:hypothetical protein